MKKSVFVFIASIAAMLSVSAVAFAVDPSGGAIIQTCTAIWECVKCLTGN